MAKAFIATAVPDTLCSLEAWHLLLGLKRVVCTRGFTSLNTDQDKALRSVAQPSVGARSRAAHQDDDEEPKNVTKKFPVERYLERFDDKTLGPRLSDEWLEACSLRRFLAEVDERDNTLRRNDKPKVVKTKPFINLDMGGAHAPRMARMALRNHRPFRSAEEDPVNIQDDAEAVRQLEEFVRDNKACPRWMQARYQIHNKVSTRKRKRDGAEPGRPHEADEPDASEAPAAEEIPAADPDADAEDGVPFKLKERTVVAGRHGMRWNDEGTYPHQAESVQGLLRKKEHTQSD